MQPQQELQQPLPQQCPPQTPPKRQQQQQQQQTPPGFTKCRMCDEVIPMTEEAIAKHGNECMVDVSNADCELPAGTQAEVGAAGAAAAWLELGKTEYV